MQNAHKPSRDVVPRRPHARKPLASARGHVFTQPGVVFGKLLSLRSVVYLLLLLLPALASAQSVSGVTGTLAQDEEITIAGSAFGTNASPAAVAWDNLEDGTCNTTPTVGAWSAVGGDLSISTTSNRHSNSTYNAGTNFTTESWAAFSGGSDSPKWFVQYWFYLASDFDFSSDINSNLGNIKIFRLWSTGSDINNLRIQFREQYDSDLVVEAADQGHDWSPVVSGYDWVDEVMGWGDPG